VNFRLAAYALLLCFALLNSLPGLAWPPTFGAEFTFSNKYLLAEPVDSHIVDSKRVRELQEKFGVYVRKLCEVSEPSCSIKVVRNKYRAEVYRVTYQDGWWFQISTDPGVIEIQTKPATVAEIKILERRMQSHIFEAAKAIGVVPQPAVGMGHIHVGIKSAFGDDAVLFRNFVVDHANHPEIFTELLGEDFFSPTISKLGKRQWEALHKLVHDFDQGPPMSIKQFTDRLRKEVYALKRGFVDDADRYQALNTLGSETVEYRSHRPQKNAAEFVDLVELHQKRIQFLRDRGGRVTLNSARRRWLESSASKMNRFKAYVQETGYDWERARALVPAKYRRNLQSQCELKIRSTLETLTGN
jgi:hypothetical protein